MHFDLELLSSYDWNDGWLLEFNQSPNELKLKIDVREVNHSNKKGERVYRNICIFFERVNAINYSFSMNHSSFEDDICSIDSINIKNIDGLLEFVIELEYGRIFTRAGAVKLVPL